MTDYSTPERRAAAEARARAYEAAQPRAEFIKQQRAAKDAFMRRFTNADYCTPAGTVGYSTEFRCDCGFTTPDAGAIWDHTCPKEL